MAFIYIDSCIIIYMIEGELSRRREIAEYLMDSGSIRHRIGFSDLSRLECLVHPLRERNDRLQSAYEFFFNGSYCRKIPLNSEVFEIATLLRARNHIKTPDAIHMAAALTGGCDIFLTNDLRLSRLDVDISVQIP